MIKIECAVNEHVTVEEIQAATGLTVRSVRRWLAALDIQPAAILGKKHLYRYEVIPEIQGGMIQASIRRKDAIRAARRRLQIITIKEAKRRAGRGEK